MDTKYYFFYGGFLSQWWRSDFEVDGVTYNTAEQYMMAGKARLFEDEEVLGRILESKNPSEQKAFGRVVRNFVKSEWDAVSRDIVYEGNYAKFTQNEDLKEKLLSTDPLILVEASPYDIIWGIGLSATDAQRLDPKNWQGMNWLGEVCTKVREDIKNGVKTLPGSFNWS